MPWRRGVVECIPNLGARWKWVVVTTPQPFWAREESTSCPLNRILGSPYCRESKHGFSVVQSAAGYLSNELLRLVEWRITNEWCGSHCPCTSQDGPTKNQEKTRVEQAASWRRIQNWAIEYGKNSTLSTETFFFSQSCDCFEEELFEGTLRCFCLWRNQVDLQEDRLKFTPAQTNKSRFS
jgi:hypothetical protein